MKQATVKVINRSGLDLPTYSDIGSAGMDVRYSGEDVTLKAGSRMLLETGLFMEIPEGYEMQLRPRSGLAIKHGISLVNSPATIDSSYRGEVKIIIINHGTEDLLIERGERICQMVLSEYTKCCWEQVETLSESERGEGGFGHTGTK